MREVRVAAFALAKHELTFGQWDVCTEYGPCRWVPDEGWGRGARPVVNVTWDDAQAYVGWLSRETGQAYRLPSAAEWSTRRVQGRRLVTVGVTTLARIAPTARAAEADGTATAHRPLGHSRPTHSAYTTCTATSWSGCRTAGVSTTSRLPRPRRLGPRATARGGASVEGHGEAGRNTCARLIGEARSGTRVRCIGDSGSHALRIPEWHVVQAWRSTGSEGLTGELHESARTGASKEAGCLG